MDYSETRKFDFSESLNRVYLASPYTHTEEKVMIFRYEEACKAAAALLNKGYLVFSPIAHSHPIAQVHNLPRDYDFWQNFSTSFLLHWAEAVVVLLLPGLPDSKGVSAEVSTARRASLPVYYL